MLGILGGEILGGAIDGGGGLTTLAGVGGGREEGEGVGFGGAGGVA